MASYIALSGLGAFFKMIKNTLKFIAE